MARARALRGHSQKQVIEYAGFGGGFVTARDPDQLADDQFQVGFNLDLDIDGRASKRKGWVKLVSTSLGDGGCKGLYEFSDNQGNDELLLAHYKTGTGMMLQRLNGSAWKHVRVALRGPVGVTAALAGGAGGAQFAVTADYLYAVCAESSGLTYANSRPCEAAYVQQANPVQQITITWKALRYAESYRVYRYQTARGWEKFDTLVTALTLTDTGSLAVTVATPPTLPVDRFPDLPGHAVVSTTFSITAGGDDGFAGGVEASYPPAGSTSGNSETTASAKRSLAGGNYSVYNALLRFDTSTLPTGITITSAVLRFVPTLINDNDARNLTGEWYGSGNWPINTADYSSTPASTAFSTDITGLTINVDNDITLTDPAANINTSGYSGFRLHVDGGAPASTNEVAIATYENTTYTEPRLIVTYTVDADANEVHWTTFFNGAVFADGRSLYRYGEYGTDILPEIWQSFEEYSAGVSIPITYLWSNVVGGVCAYSTAIAYVGSRSMEITTTNEDDGAELLWPLAGGLADGEWVRCRFRHAVRAASVANAYKVTLEILDAGGSTLQTTTTLFRPELVWQEVGATYAARTTVSGSTAASVRIRIRQNTATAGVLYVDDFHVLIDSAEVVRPYVPTAAEITATGANLLLTASNPLWQARQLAEHANRLWLVDVPGTPTFGYYSDTFDYQWIPAPNTARTETANDDRIRGIINHRQRLIIWSGDNMQRVTGTGPADYAVSIVNAKVGCIAPFSPVSVDNDLIWVARDGIWRARSVDGIQDQLDLDLISEPIQPTVTGPSVTYVTPLTSLATAYAAHHDGQYKVVFPSGINDLPTLLRWYKPGQIRGKGGVWAAPDDQGFALRFLLARKSGRIVGASSTVGVVYQQSTASSGYSDDGTVITAYFWKRLALGDPSRPKALYEMRMKAGKFAAAAHTVNLQASGTVGTQNADLTFAIASANDVLRGIIAEWKSADLQLEEQMVTAVVALDSTATKASDVHILAFVVRPLWG